jgi:excisionase family DNA binding protein
METQLLTPMQVADRLQITVNTVYIWLREGRIPGVRLGHRWRVQPEALAALVGGSSSPVAERAVQVGSIEWARAILEADRVAESEGTGIDEPSETTGEALLRILDEVTRDVPDEEWDSVPHDGAVNHDHYLYGLPKRKEFA